MSRDLILAVTMALLLLSSCSTCGQVRPELLDGGARSVAPVPSAPAPTDPGCPLDRPQPCGAVCCYAGDQCIGGRCVVTDASFICPATLPVICPGGCCPADTVSCKGGMCFFGRVEPDATGACLATAPVVCGLKCCPSDTYCNRRACPGSCTGGGDNGVNCKLAAWVPSLSPLDCSGAGATLCGGTACCPEGTTCEGGACVHSGAAPGCPPWSRLCDGGRCCATGSVCGPGGCGCSVDEVACRAGCCDTGTRCSIAGDACLACPADHPVICGASDCCLPEAACEISECRCPASLPVVCGDLCCGPEATCTNGSCTACPADHATPCGEFCCADDEACVDGKCDREGGGGGCQDSTHSLQTCADGSTRCCLDPWVCCASFGGDLDCNPVAFCD